LLCLALVLLATLLVSTPATRVASPPGDVVLAPAANRAPVTPDVEEVPVRGASREGLAIAGARADRHGAPLAALSGAEKVDGFAVAGATWEPGTAPDGMLVEVRSRQDGEWSEWEEVEVHDDHGPDPDSPEARGARAGSDAIVLGDVEEVQTRVTSPDGSAPEGLRMAVVESDPVAADTPGEAPAEGDDTDGDVAEELEEVASTPARPTILTRKQWGADESLRSGSPSYGVVRAGFVHHTVNANGYTSSQVPGIIRGIYAYHTRSRGWSDIGYNFLVDRFGRIWEGRYGGVARPVIGAHTLGYNQYAFAMSAIGNFETATPSTKMLAAYGRLMGWKLAVHGIRADQRSSLGGTVFPAISGHRDAGQTACPGRYLYAKIGAIRNRAVAYQGTTAVTPPSNPDAWHDLVGSAKPDLVYRDRRDGTLKVRPGADGPRFGPQRLTGRYLTGSDFVLAGPDLTGDGRPDILERRAVSKDARILRGLGDASFSRPGAPMSSFRAADLMTAVGDMNGDGRNDVVTRTSAHGHVWFYPGDGSGGFGKPRVVLRSRAWFVWLAGVGDVDGDRRPDLVAADAKGRLRLFAGNGRGGVVVPGRIIGSGWSNRDLVAGGANVGMGPKADLVARDRSDGRIWIYKFGKDATVYGRTGGWLGTRNLNRLSVVRDVTGDGRSDLVGRRKDGQIVVKAGNSGTWLGRVRVTGGADDKANAMRSAGDWNADGRGDVLVRKPTGRMRFWAGNGSGGLTLLPTILKGWGTMQHVVPVGDVTGDRFDDLLAQDQDRRMWVYPGTGTGKPGARFLARGTMIESDLAIAAGRWNGDARPDLIVRKPNGVLFLYPTDKSGRLSAAPVRLGGGFGRYDQIVGRGDITGDGRPDLVAREAATGYLWLLPGSSSGIGPRRFMADAAPRLDLIG